MFFVSVYRKWLAPLIRPVTVGLAAVLLAFVLVGVLAADTADGATGTLGQQLSDIRGDLTEVRANLKKAEAARKAALDDLASFDQSVEYAQRAYKTAHSAYKAAKAQLSELQGQLDGVVAQIEDNQQELEETQQELTVQQEVLCDRVVGIYKSGGNLSYVAALLSDGSTSLGEVMEGFNLLSVIAEQDAQILSQLEKLERNIAEQRRGLDAEHSRVSVLKDAQAAVTAELRAADQECKAALREVETAQAAKKAVLAAAEKDKAKWTRQEDKLEADSDRITALLKSTGSWSATKVGKGYLSLPVTGRVCSPYGMRMHPIFHVRKMHTGVDFACPMGEAIRAAAPGTVIQAGWRGGYGKCVVIDHGGGLATLYAHESVILVSVGDEVKRGRIIGEVGSTGYSTGPHLHFEVRVNGSPVDPMGYL